jgi:hypothetical protein
MKYYQLKRSKLSSREQKENAQFEYLNKKYGGDDTPIEFIRVRDVRDRLVLEDDDDIQELSILKLVPQAKKGDWIHLRLNDFDWRRLGIRKTLKGQHRMVQGVTITYGRWSERNDDRAKYLTDEFDDKVYAHVLGMFHEKYHAEEGSIAVVHSFLYGYDRLYTKLEEKRLKPKRNYQNMSLIKLIEYFCKKKEPEKKVPEITKTPAFDKAVELIFKHEGGYVNHSSDPGGETKYGISKRAYPTLNIKGLTKNQAKDIYYRDYWIAGRCDKMPYSVAIQVFDMGVNAGVKRASQILQKVLGVSQDGIIGPVTLKAIQKMNDNDIFDYFLERQLYYQSLKTFKTFGKGWTRRNTETLKISLTN